MGWMKKTLLAAIAILSVGSVAVPVATALTINIDDRTEGGEVLTVSGINLPGLFMAANFLIVVSDPGTTNVSDIISVVVTPHATSATTNFDIVFTSDSEIPLAAPAPPPFGVTELFITETGLFQTIYSSHDLSTQGNPDWTFRFASDVETTVPEPATLALLVVGLAGLGFSRRRHSN